MEGSQSVFPSAKIPQLLQAAQCSQDFAVETSAGTLAKTLPGVPVSRFRNWLGQRLVWVPGGARTKRAISIVSSRLGDRLDLRRSWFDALRTAIIRIDPETEQLCVVRGTAIERIVLRAAELFDVPVTIVDVASEELISFGDLADWIAAIEASSMVGAPSRILISPEVDQDASTDRLIPDVDAAAALHADRVLVLSCRAGGYVESSIRRRLAESVDGTVLLLKDQSLTKKEPFQRLVDDGSVPWILERSQVPAHSGDLDETPIVHQSDNVGPLNCPDEWLCHWTRARSGPWPDESAEDHLDALILGCDSADHSAFAAVVRIAETGRLLRTALSKNCVSLTELPLSEFRGRRTYRRHLRRYDFEPWGVAIRKSALARLGAEPVKYLGNPTVDADWNTHPKRDRSGSIDWSLEREWRFPGDIVLTELNPADLVFFVDSQIEANMLGKLVEWPVVVVPNDSEAGNRQKNGK